jgi:GAF domain-containing protein
VRGAFVADGATWGAVIMIRTAGGREFSRDEIDLLDRSSALFARAVRRGLVTEASRVVAPPCDAPGVLELDASGRLERASSTAEPLLEELSGTTAEQGGGRRRCRPWPAPRAKRSRRAPRSCLARR